ncbi:MAG: GNAT family N-acetyltransferase [SAR202 cluster bacterium]|nr:GNAT family N-acetyltransferase [SAR202 cluster bacterium]
MRIALLYNEPLPSRYDTLGEADAVSSVMDAVDAVGAALKALGHQVATTGLVPPLSETEKQLRTAECDLFFNLFEGFDGAPDTEWRLARKLESLAVPFTGASAATLKLCQDKARCKDRLAADGIPTAPYQLLDSENIGDLSLGLPVIVKPLREDASHGLNAQSVAWQPEDVAAQVLRVEEAYGGPVLVERYLPGREFNVSVLGGLVSKTLSTTEITYSKELPEPRILTYRAKWSPDDREYIASMPVCPAQVSDSLGDRLKEITLASCAAVGLPSYARVDLRCDDLGAPYVLEVNPNPDLSPDAGLAMQARAAGLDYGGLVQSIVELAIMNDRITQPTLREMEAGEVDVLVRITKDTGFFRPDEVEVAREVLSAAEAHGENSGYHVRVATDVDGPLGYVCYGPTPMTKGTWDIYWLAVDRNVQKRGIGSRLMRLAEDQIRLKKGRMAVLETSSQEMYEPTQRFYRSLGYQEVCRISDFYDTGDDKITFAKLMGAVNSSVRPP